MSPPNRDAEHCVSIFRLLDKLDFVVCCEHGRWEKRAKLKPSAKKREKNITIFVNIRGNATTGAILWILHRFIS